MLLRRYIAKRLADYYAQPSNLVVGSAAQPLNFKSLWGEWHWKRVHRDLYEHQHGQWLTPVELFRPYYSQVLVDYCVQQQLHNFSSTQEFEIVELGGGRGTNASCMLHHFEQRYPEVYERLSRYTIIDSSPSLYKLQRELLAERYFSSKLHFQLTDLTDVAESKADLIAESKTPTMFLALEVFDNLGHDKVKRDSISQKLEHAVIEDGKEIFRPLTDDLLRQILLKVPSYGGTMGQPAWIPSVACGVLMDIAKKRSNAWILVADFDYLPPPDLSDADERKRQSVFAEGEPLVTDMEDMDHCCYLDSPHLSDILFPTDFVKLSRFCKNVFGSSNVSKQGRFLLDVGPSQVQETTNRWTGYSPMIHDFYNCSILTVNPPY
jgi:SAM-dependent MidA family methyltransferase